jgi:hypothetical protein
VTTMALSKLISGGAEPWSTHELVSEKERS